MSNINYQNGEGLKDNLFMAEIIAPVASSTNTPGENMHNTDSDSDDNNDGVTIGVNTKNKIHDGDIVHQMNLIKDAQNSTHGNVGIDYNQNFRE